MACRSSRFATILSARGNEESPRRRPDRVGGDLPTARITNYALLESLNWLHERQRHDIAVDLRTRLVESAGFELVHCAQKDFTKAMELFETHERLAFGDATTVAYMVREGIEYLYNDFDVIEGITRLSTADNPFG